MKTLYESILDIDNNSRHMDDAVKKTLNDIFEEDKKAKIILNWIDSSLPTDSTDRYILKYFDTESIQKDAKNLSKTNKRKVKINDDYTDESYACSEYLSRMFLTMKLFGWQENFLHYLNTRVQKDTEVSIYDTGSRYTSHNMIFSQFIIYKITCRKHPELPSLFLNIVFQTTNK